MPTLTDALKPVAQPRLSEQALDYHRMADALAWLAEHWLDRPSLEEAAAAVGLSPYHFQRVFTRWAGVSPKTFMAAIAHAEARGRLEAGVTVLEAAYDVGLSGPSRLHDLFVTVEAITPGAVRNRGQNVEIVHGFAPCPFGVALVAETARGLCGLAFCNQGEEQKTLQDMRDRWPAATWIRDDARAVATAEAVFRQGGAAPPMVLMGPPFHVQVWRALLRIPTGFTATYGQVATWAGRPDAPRAAGAAIGANPISFLIPCHRAIAKDGRLTGYHWGLDRKVAMLGREALERWGRDAACTRRLT
jgi:AraC family transcriptional regulator of adaptative response/methylated-DNA-[protein]-cysteine methyltransferase